MHLFVNLCESVRYDINVKGKKLTGCKEDIKHFNSMLNICKF